MNSIRFLPETPAVSRFVAPWDTCGWYAAYENLHVGAPLYTNAATRVLGLPAAYEGADYIRMFDSEAQGFDDKQEICFRTECEAILGLALDPNGPQPDWLRDFTRTDASLVTDLGVWPVYERECGDDELVVIPGLKGRGHHYFPMIRRKTAEAPRELPAAAWPAGSLPACAHRTYRAWAQEFFLTPDALERYEAEACAPLPGAGVKISGRLAVPFEAKSGRVVLEATFAAAERYDGSVALRAADGTALFSLPLASVPQDGRSLSLRLIFDLDLSLADIWVNHRVRETGVPFSAQGAPESVDFAAMQSPLTLECISLCDDTEIYAADESMAALPETMQAVLGTLERAPFPFEGNGSALIAGAGAHGAAFYRFPAMDGAMTFETKIRCDKSVYCEAPALLDETGAPLLRVAIYKNNLYATDGGVWRRMTSGVTDWQYYPCNNWLLVNLKVDLRRGTYSLFVDGALRAKDYALDHAAPAVCAAGFLAGEGGRLYVNRIRVYDDFDLSRALLPAAPVMNVYDFGARGDGKTMDTAAIQAAVDAAAKVGGTVLLREGTFLTGEIALRSNVTFWVDRSAVLLGSRNHADYPLHTPGTSLCASRQLGRGLLYGENLRHVRVAGGGMLDGDGLYRFKENDPVRNREPLSRPCVIYITYSSDVTVESIHMRRSCFWTVVPLSCRNVLLRHLDLDCMYTPNRDGIDPVDVCDMSIYDCAVMAGDDGLCFKSSDAFGCERIDVWDMMLQSLASGFKFGTDTYYSLRDFTLRDCSMKNINRCGISLEAVDGAEIDNVLFERVDMVDVGAPAYVAVGCRNRVPRGGAPERHAHIRSVTFRDLRFEAAYPFSYSPWIREVLVVGQSPEQAACNVRFENCTFSLPGGGKKGAQRPEVINRQYPEYDQHGPSAGSVFTARYAKNFVVENLQVEFEKADERGEIVEFDRVE